MKLELVDQRSQAGPLPLDEGQLATLVAGVGHPDWELNLVLVDDPVMADLNARWYGGEGVTDVLSFSYLEAEGQGPPRLARGEGRAAHDLWVAPGDDTDEVTAGEVIMAPAFVAERCAREGWDLTVEWAMLLVHGALHILGWVHDTPDGRRAMKTEEADLLRRQGFDHPLPEIEAED